MTTIAPRLAIEAARFALEWANNLPCLWVSAGGGTANVLAGELCRFAGCSFEEAHQALDVAGGPDWYFELHRAYGWWHSSPGAQGVSADARGLSVALRRRFVPSLPGEEWEDLDVLLPPGRSFARCR